jgi:rhodopsin domain-containing protein
MIIGAYCALSYITIEVLLFSFWCHPFHDYWSVPPANLQCAVYRNHLILVLVLNVSSDIMIMGIPLPLLIRTRLSLVKKLSLCAVFSLGIFVVFCSFMSKIYGIYNPYGTQWELWYIREAGTAVVVANLPHTWSLMRRVFNLRSFLSSGSSNTPQAAPPEVGRIEVIARNGYLTQTDYTLTDYTLTNYTLTD